MQMLREHPWYAEGNSQRLTSLAFVLVAIIAAVDSVLVIDVGFGFLYLIPLGIAAAFLSRWQIVILSVICTAFAEAFAVAFSTLPHVAGRIPRIVFSLVGYTFVTIVIRELVAVGRAASRRMSDLEEEASSRHGIEEQLEL